MDNVFIEQLWRSLKSEAMYLPGYADGQKAKAGIVHWIAFYNTARPHQALGYPRLMALWCDGIKCETGATTVDVTARLDTACVLPTAPQPQQYAA